MVCASGGHRSSNELVWYWSYAQIAFRGPHGVASHDCLTDTFPGDKMSDRDPSLANLPSEPEITRRDFVGGTLVGTGRPSPSPSPFCSFGRRSTASGCARAISSFAAASELESLRLLRHRRSNSKASARRQQVDGPSPFLTACVLSCRAWRIRAASCAGGQPKKRAYSRLNCEALSYPTSNPTCEAPRPPAMSSDRACER